MGKIPYILAFVGLLAACNDGGSPSSGYQRPGNFQPGNRPYENRAKTDNKKRSKSYFSLQIKNFIKRLQSYNYQTGTLLIKALRIFTAYNPYPVTGNSTEQNLDRILP